MTKQKKIKQTLVVVLTVILAGFMTGGACEDSPAKGIVEDIAKQCGFTCSEGIAQGNASITGVASIDGFFGSVVAFDAKATKVSADIEASLQAIADSVDMTGGADADFAAGFQAAVAAKFHLDANAGVKIEYQEPKCEVSASASIEATAKCDATVTPGSVSASCSGKCEVEPGSIDVSAKCEGGVDAKIECTGTAPDLVCTGECTGGCELEAAATCEGSCSGTCSVDISGECSGTCKGSCSGTCSAEDGNGNCAGECDGTCEGSCEVAASGKCEGSCSGTCELEAGATCDGKCTGSCKYEPGSASCEGGATAEIYCEAQGNVQKPKVECEASCDAEVTPPSASAECEASAKAEANLSAECTPPSIGVSYEFDATYMASLDAEAQANLKAEFKAWLTLFKNECGNLLSAMARADIVIEAGKGMITASTTVVKNAGAELAADANLMVAFKMGTCLPTQLTAVAGVINGATSELAGNVTASGKLITSLKM